MSRAENSGSDAELDVKSTVLHYFKHQPFLHLLLLCILGSVVWLAHTNKADIIPEVVKVGFYSVLVTLVGVATSWFAPRIQAVAESIPHMVRSFDSLATAYGVLSRFVAATNADRTRNNKLVLLVEDSATQARAIRGLCADLVAEFHLSFRDVGSLDEAYAYIQSACVAIIDVTLPDNDGPDAINILIALSGCPVIIHTGTAYTKDDFPGAFAVICKDDAADYGELRAEMRSAIASTRFPT